MKTYLETDRVYLREFTDTEKDIDLLFDLNSDPDVMKYLGAHAPTRDEIKEVNDRVLKYYIRPTYQQRYGVWAAHLRSNDEFIGFFILRPPKDEPDNLKFIELGYRLRKKFWRQGLSYEVSKALLHRCFTKYDVDTVYADAHPDNEGSIGVMKKIGLKYNKHYHHEELMKFLGSDQVVRYLLNKDDYKG